MDISAHLVSVVPDEHIKVIHPPAGNDCGGSRVNKEFARFLQELVRDEDFTKYVSTGITAKDAAHKAYLNELINDTFETQKRIFGDKGGVGGKLSIRLPFSFMEVYKGRLEAGIQRIGDSRIELSGMDLRIEYAKIEELFKPVVDGLLKCIAETVKDVEAKVDLIYLVGGFGGCRYVYNAISERFGKSYKYVTPAEPDFAVVRGAVLFRRNPDIVQSRRADATYGVRANIPFVEGVHEDDYKWTNASGEAQCSNIFSTFVERGDILSTNEVMVRTYKPESLLQSTMHIDIYTSTEKDVWYTTVRRPSKSSVATPVDILKVGELIVPLHNLDTESAQGADEHKDEREIDVMLDFSHTEVQVKGYDRTAKTEVKVVLDFLSN